jgi:nucleoside-diphosphate-sugar epimerase
MKILITGINGFVGSNLVQKFKSDYTLYGLDINLACPTGVNRVFSWQELNLIPEVDIIIHLAGKAHDTKNTAAEQEYYDINLGLTKIIFDHFGKTSAQKFFMMSSVKAVTDKVEGILDETEAPAPKTPYGKSKLLAEQYINSIQLPSEKEVYIYRPCMIHGTGNKGNLNLLFKFVKTGIPYPLGAFNNLRSFLSIDNYCFIVKEMIERDIEGGTYNLADTQPISTNELITLIGEGLGKSASIYRIPVGLVKFVAKLGDYLKLPLNSERLNKLTENYVVSNKKILKTLGKELPIDSKEGILKTIRSFL